ncbi:hypothetical protein V8C44DRAFT_262945 [Trichoderma aethiopicum]
MAWDSPTEALSLQLASYKRPNENRSLTFFIPVTSNARLKQPATRSSYQTPALTTSTPRSLRAGPTTAGWRGPRSCSRSSATTTQRPFHCSGM